jgi:hypothetical protein
MEDAVLVVTTFTSGDRCPETVTVAPGRTPPCPSVTVPDNAALSCAANGLATPRPTHTSRTTRPWPSSHELPSQPPQ